jgi:adenosylcobinamide-GDP ribazoletransferase
MPAIVRRFLLALQFLTRFPVAGNLATTADELGEAAAFFPLVGTIVGASAAAVFLFTNHFLPASASVLIAIASATFITNGFHEDGLADTFDALGGAWTKDRALEIMRDSRLGTYGTLALIFLLLGKYTFLSSLEPRQIWRWLIVAHTASRWTTLPLCMWLPYARAEGQGKLVAKQIGSLSLVAGTITLALFLLLLPFKARLIVFAITLLVTFASGIYFKRRLDGITGDTLGAANQVNEVLLYLTALLLGM